jgi:hypothetical protein
MPNYEREERLLLVEPAQAAHFAIAESPSLKPRPARLSPFSVGALGSGGGYPFTDLRVRGRVSRGARERFARIVQTWVASNSNGTPLCRARPVTRAKTTTRCLRRIPLAIPKIGTATSISRTTSSVRSFSKRAGRCLAPLSGAPGTSLCRRIGRRHGRSTGLRLTVFHRGRNFRRFTSQIAYFGARGS